MSIKNLVIKMAGKVPFSLRSRVKNIPLLKQFQAYLLQRWVNKEEFVATISGGPAKGLVFPVQMPQDKLMWIGTWELDFASKMQEIIRPGWVCFDIGGYKGYYSGVMALKGAKAVYVFEPMSSNIENIKKLISLNTHLPIQLKEYAVAETTGKSFFKVMAEETMGKLDQSTFQVEDLAMSEVEVDCIRLDDLIHKGIPDPDFIKIDVEGAEEFVIRGGVDLLSRKKPFLMIEVHSPEIGKSCLGILEKYYGQITVLETGLHPREGTPEICHYLVTN